MTENTDPTVIASCLSKCVFQDVCKGCVYLDTPNGYKGECINRMMVEAADTLRLQRNRIVTLQRLHESLKRTNKKLLRENRELRKKGGKNDL